MQGNCKYCNAQKKDATLSMQYAIGTLEKQKHCNLIKCEIWYTDPMQYNTLCKSNALKHYEMLKIIHIAMCQCAHGTMFHRC